MKAAIKAWLADNGYEDKSVDNSQEVGGTLSEVVEECIAHIGNKWISVDDELPQDDFEVLTCSDDDVTLSVYRENIDGSYYFDGMVNVTHWQPKPEPVA